MKTTFSLQEANEIVSKSWEDLYLEPREDSNTTIEDSGGDSLDTVDLEVSIEDKINTLFDLHIQPELFEFDAGFLTPDMSFTQIVEAVHVEVNKKLIEEK